MTIVCVCVFTAALTGEDVCLTIYDRFPGMGIFFFIMEVHDLRMKETKRRRLDDLHLDI